jgi:Domain of unknown function (DUF4365)
VGQDIGFPLRIKNYDDLGRATHAPRWLVVMFVPTACADWLDILMERAVVRQCAWWQCLQGQPAVKNSTSVTVYLPYQNLLTPAALIRRLNETEQQFRPI